MGTVGDTGGLTWTLEPSHFPAAPTRWGAEDRGHAADRGLGPRVRRGGPSDRDARRSASSTAASTRRSCRSGARRGSRRRRCCSRCCCGSFPSCASASPTSRSWAADDRPTQIIDEWLGGKERKLRAEGRRLIAIDADSLSGPKLADLIDEVLAVRDRRLVLALPTARRWGLAHRRARPRARARPWVDRHRVRAAVHRPLRREHGARGGTSRGSSSSSTGPPVVRRSTRRPRSTR